MAKVFGESGRYVSREAVKRSESLILQLATTAGLVGFVAGLFIGAIFPIGKMSIWVHLWASFLAVGTMSWFAHKCMAKLKDLQKEREAMRRGADGERQVGEILSNLPNDFCVINDVPGPFGNLDHIVIGSTGVFVLETKNWRGVVSSDGKGELLLNGQATDKREVRQFVGRTMGIRETVRKLIPEYDPFYQALLIFTAARVNAKWGTTSSANCLRDYQIHEYIVEKSRASLSRVEVERLAQALPSLAHMDREFSRAA